MKKTKDEIQNEALTAIRGFRRAGVGITVGGGKTLLGLKHMDENYSEHARFLVGAPKKSIHKEWISQAEEHGLSHLIPHITFTTYRSLHKMDLDYDVFYIDECHSLKFSHQEWLDAFTGKTIGLTGTEPAYEKSEKGIMVGKYCPIVYTYDTEEAIEDNLLNDYRIIVHTLELGTTKDILIKKGASQWYTSERAGYDYWTNRLDVAYGKEAQICRIMRMKAMQNLKSKEILAKKLFESTKNKVILFADTQDQADRLCKHSVHANNPDSGENLEAFKKGEIMKLSCVHQISEGANIPNLKEGIILHSFGNEVKATQKIGRMVRLNPDDVATINILCYKNTVDVDWVKQALKKVNNDKIEWR